MLIHLTAVTRGFTPFRDSAAARWFWDRLRSTFPEALAAMLMPNHVHVVGDDEPEAARRALSSLLARFMRGRGRGEWKPVGLPTEIRDQAKLLRDIRYVALNPCREGLCRDPLEWVWSSHRDVVGAAADPWVTGSRLSAALGMRAEGFARKHHAYVSSDPSVDPGGTRLPVAVPGSEHPVAGLSRWAARRHGLAPAVGLDAAVLCLGDARLRPPL